MNRDVGMVPILVSATFCSVILAGASQWFFAGGATMPKITGFGLFAFALIAAWLVILHIWTGSGNEGS